MSCLAQASQCLVTLVNLRATYMQIILEILICLDIVSSKNKKTDKLCLWSSTFIPIACN